jgi:hypothetical protein
VLQFVFDNSRKKSLATHLWPLLLDLPLAEGLSPAQVSHIFLWMAEYFRVMRTQMELVQAWAIYMTLFSRLLALLVEAIMRHQPEAAPHIKAIMNNLIAIFQEFLFPSKEVAQQWGANEITSTSYLLRSMVDPLKRLSTVFPIVLETIWRWIVTVTHRGELTLQQQSVLFNSEWTKLPWYHIGIPPSEVVSDVLRVAQSFIPASPMYSFALQLLQASYRPGDTPQYLRNVFDITLYVLATSTWPVTAPFASFLKSAKQLSWSKLPADLVAKSPFVPQYVFQRYKSNKEYTQAIKGTLDIEYDPTSSYYRRFQHD